MTLCPALRPKGIKQNHQLIIDILCSIEQPLGYAMFFLLTLIKTSSLRSTCLLKRPTDTFYCALWPKSIQHDNQ